MRTGYLHGIEGIVARVMMSKTAGPGFSIKGLSEASSRETRVRVECSIKNSGFDFPKSALIEVAPTSAKKDGTGFDLPIALACLGFDGAAVGELSLQGEIRPARGILSIVEALKINGEPYVIVAPENAREAELVEGISVLKCRTLKEAADLLRGVSADSSSPTSSNRFEVRNGQLDMRDVKGLEEAKAALEKAAVSGENLLLLGPPGAGKTMLARRFISILPGLTKAEAFEVTRIHSVAGLNIGGDLITQRPFRAPHHSTTAPGLVGGGATVRPGEISLAHNGVLFLDELAEFGRTVIEAMRESVQSKEVLLNRTSGIIRMPANCQIIASSSHCMCGCRNDGTARCRCSPESIKRHQTRLDDHCLCLGIKLRIDVGPTDLSQLAVVQLNESSAEIRARVERARGL